MDLYREYLNEREKCHLYELEGKGFLTFTFQVVGNEKIIYIQDIYVRPQFRKHNVASEMADYVCANAKKTEGVTKLIGSVDLSAEKPERSMAVLLGYGMVPYMTEGHVIYFQKAI